MDPTTGEIVNASVLVYNDVIRLINNWRFVQTAQIDPSVRAKKMPDDIVKESIAYVVAHEVGHCLGFSAQYVGLPLTRWIHYVPHLSLARMGQLLVSWTTPVLIRGSTRRQGRTFNPAGFGYI